jgi:hypothetical protein
MLLTPKQETKPWSLHAFCRMLLSLPATCQKQLSQVYENEAYDARIVLIVENRLLISSIRKIGVPAEIQVTPYVLKLISARGAEKDFAVVSLCNATPTTTTAAAAFLSSKRSKFINRKSRYCILHVLVNIFLIILIRSRGA